MNADCCNVRIVGKMLSYAGTLVRPRASGQSLGIALQRLWLLIRGAKLVPERMKQEEAVWD